MKTKLNLPNASVRATKPLEVGDRVMVWRPGKPWHGHSGEVAVAPRMMALFGALPERMYLEVSLDSGSRCGAEPHEVRRID